VLVPVCALVAVAVGAGLLTSGGSGRQAQHGVAADGLQPAYVDGPTPEGQGKFSAIAKPPSIKSLPITTVPATNSTALGRNAYSVTSPAPSGSRHQLYSADLRLRVSDLSETTKKAISLTRGWGGYLVTVDYGSGQKSGEAYLVVRVPIAKVQTALAKLTSLGTILADHVSIRDIQGQLNRRFSRMAELNAQIASLRAKLTDTTLTTSQRAFFEAALAQRQARLTTLHDEQTAQKTRASFATVSLALETKKAAAVVPSKPTRIGEAMHNIGRVLVTEAEILLYVLLIGAPFVILGVLLWLSLRSLRRRSDEQLLAR
jgi:hypothetical protein